MGRRGAVRGCGRVALHPTGVLVNVVNIVVEIGAIMRPDAWCGSENDGNQGSEDAGREEQRNSAGSANGQGHGSSSAGNTRATTRLPANLAGTARAGDFKRLVVIDDVTEGSPTLFPPPAATVEPAFQICLP